MPTDGGAYIDAVDFNAALLAYAFGTLPSWQFGDDSESQAIVT